jgi:hypothetical protein
LHGLGFGSEWAAGAVLMGEVIRERYRGRGVDLVQDWVGHRVGRFGAGFTEGFDTVDLKAATEVLDELA